ncbi:hypothetical protein B7494_g1144 [Chlorociboria aeruginascens]|nr:hypothetical protein B7494_g1144 [Chlorociboria aeruginascens]
MGDASVPEGEHILAVLPFPEPTELIAKLKEKHPNTKFTYVTRPHVFDDTKAPDELFKEATVLCTLSALPASADLAPKLKFIHFFSAGTDHIQKHPIYTHSKIPLTTSSGIHGPTIAEWVIMQILAHAHREKLLLQWQKERKWGNREFGFIRDLVGQRLGVLGYGSIGRQSARAAKAMGMDIIAYTASPRKTPESKKDTGYIVPHTGDPNGTLPSAWYSGLDKPSLHKFLSQDIDILLVSVPLTSATRHFLGAEEFAILGKKNTFVVNISRGSILQQDDLIAALKKPQEEGGLRGAALDVTDPEPLNEDSELWGLQNVAITPHISGLGTTYAERSFEILDRNLGNLEKGEKLINLVDRKRGY